MRNNDGAALNDTENASIPLENRIRKKLQKLPPLSPSCFIYRVLERLRSLNPSLYTPKVVSISPLHYGKETLQDMEEHKYRNLQHFLDRTNENLEFYIQKIRSYEADRIMGPPRMVEGIDPDLLLLENQLPFFILEELFDPEKVDRKLNSEVNRKVSFIQLCLAFFKDQLEAVGVDCSLERILRVDSSDVKGEHFLDVIRNLCLPPEPQVRRTRNIDSPVAPTITELHQAGVKFEVGSTRNLFGIRFKNGILQIPKLEISRLMECTLSNIAVFEQCHYFNRRIADYLDLLDCFVNTSKDVELLAEHGIVTITVGDNSEACSLINNLSKGCYWFYDDFYFAQLYEDLNKDCKKPWNKWKANLRQSYLNTPWAVVSVVAAAFLIILTIIQTDCSLISF